MELNNKGFAITGILYTLFVMFLLILISILSSLSLKKNILEQSTTKLEDSFIGSKINIEDATIKDETTTDIYTKVSGKYIFKVKNIETNTKCITYLKKGVNLSNIKDLIFTTTDCNDFKENLNLQLEEVYSFDRKE